MKQHVIPKIKKLLQIDKKTEKLLNLELKPTLWSSDEKVIKT